MSLESLKPCLSAGKELERKADTEKSGSGSALVRVHRECAHSRRCAIDKERYFLSRRFPRLRYSQSNVVVDYSCQSGQGDR